MAKCSRKRNNRVIALLACIALVIGLLPATASAEGGQTTDMPLAANALGATRGTSGTCGDNLTWVLDDEGTLTISGTGGILDVAFKENSNIKNVVIGEGVTAIGGLAFGKCTSLTSVTIPSSVTSIGNQAFLNCTSLKSVEIPETSKLTTISPSAFANCVSLESVKIPASVKSLAYDAFTGCDSLKDIYYNGTEEQWREIPSIDRLIKPGSTTIHFVYYVTVTANPETGGTVDGGGRYEYQDPPATVTATANTADNYVFVNWTDDSGATVSTAASYTLTKEEKGNRNLRANFKHPLTITAKDQTYAYDGDPHGEADPVYDKQTVIDKKVSVTGLMNGDELTSVVLSGTQTEAGVYPGEIKITGATIDNKPASENDNYEIIYAAGKLTIKPAEVTVTTGSATKVYDGKALTNGEASIEGLVNGEAATVKATGSQTEVGSSKNTCSIEWGTAKAENYTVTEKLGTLTVEAAPAKKGTLTFDLAGGKLDGKTGTITVVANVGDTVKLPGEPTRKGYTFKYWKGSRYEAGAEYKVEGDHAFTAVWEKNSSSGSGSSGKSSSGRTAKTGDPLGLVPPLVIALVAVSGLALAISWRRRRG